MHPRSQQNILFIFRQLSFLRRADVMLLAWIMCVCVCDFARVSLILVSAALCPVFFFPLLPSLANFFTRERTTAVAAVAV